MLRPAPDARGRRSADPGPHGSRCPAAGAAVAVAPVRAAVAAAAGSSCFLSVSVPLTGPKHVVPEYGIVSVVLSTSVPVPFSVNGQGRIPAIVAVPDAVRAT